MIGGLAGTAWSGSGPLHVFSGAGVDLDFFAGFDEEGGLDGDAGFQDDGFLNVVGGITADSFWSIRDGEDDAGGQLNFDGFVADEGHRHVGVFDEIIHGIADDFRREIDCFKCFWIGKDVILAVLVAELHLAGVEGDDLDFFCGTKSDVGRFSGADAADASLDESAQVAWGAMLSVEDDGDVAIIINRHALTDVVCCCHNV